jgi:hypothetical protein
MRLVGTDVLGYRKYKPKNIYKENATLRLKYRHVTVINAKNENEL